MARITGKNAKIKGELSHTSVATDTVMLDSGDHITYSFQSYWYEQTTPLRVKVNGAIQASNTYTVSWYDGKIIFNSAKNPTDVVQVCFFDYSTLADIGDMFNWVIDAKLDVIPVTAFQDQFRVQLSGFRNWTASAEGYHVSAFWFHTFNIARLFYFEFYPDTSGAEKFIGAGFVDFGVNCAFDSVVKSPVSINGSGGLYRTT